MKKQSPVRETGVCCHTRNCTTAYPFPSGGRFAWFPGTATKGWSAGPFCLLLRKTCPPEKQPRCHDEVEIHPREPLVCVQAADLGKPRRPAKAVRSDRTRAHLEIGCGGGALSNLSWTLPTVRTGTLPR